MRVCLISFDSVEDCGGIQWSLKRIALLLSEADYEVHIVRLASVISEEEWKNNTQVIHELNDLTTKIKVFKIIPWLSPYSTTYADHEVCDGLMKLDKKYHYDIFHCLGIEPTAYLVTWAAILLNKPVIVSGRGTDINRGIFRPMNLHCVGWILKNATWLTFVSVALRYKAMSIVDCVHKTSVIHNSTDLSFFNPPLPAGISDRSDFLIGGAGVFGLKKGADILCLAFKKLAAQTGIRLHWIGELARKTAIHGRFTESFNQFLQSEQLTITGRVPHEDMLLHLQQLDVFIIASGDEGCPNTLLEEMLAKIAQFYEEEVNTAIAGLTSMIEPLIIGFLGIVIGGIVVSLFLPILKITQLITH